MDANKRQAADEEVTIDLLEVLYVFRRNLVWMLLFAILGALFAGLYTYFGVTPLYKASAKLYIVSTSNDVINLSDLQIGTNLAADYKELILLRPVLEQVIQNLQLDCTTSQLRSMLSVSNTSGTRILQITATTTEPALSRDIANEMAKVAREWLPAAMNGKTPNIVEEAVAPKGRSSPSYTRNVMIGGLLGIVIVCAVLVIRMLMNDTVVTAEDMEKYFGTMPLTTIPEEEGVTDIAEE